MQYWKKVKARISNRNYALAGVANVILKTKHLHMNKDVMYYRKISEFKLFLCANFFYRFRVVNNFFMETDRSVVKVER